MPGNGRNPLGRFTFLVEIGGIETADFLSVSPLESLSTVIEIRSGNDLAGRKFPGPSRYSNIVLRRTYTGNNILWQWRREIERGVIDRRSGSVILIAPDRTEVERFNFHEAWPARWQLGPWDAAEDGMLIEEIELAVERIEAAS